MLSDVVSADIADYASQLQCEQAAKRLGYIALR
jgi:hypothetical protein